MPPPRLILRHLLPSRRPTTTTTSSPILTPQQTRHESTTRRHKKLLHIAPTPSYTPTPSTLNSAPHILYNPPSAAPSVYHTPLKFLPASDKRRALFAAHQNEVARKQLRERVSPVAVTGTSLAAPSVLEKRSVLRAIAAANTTHKTSSPWSSNSVSASALPPPVRAPYEKKYHITASQIAEIQALRQQDPERWTRVRLAEKFGCSQFFVGLVAKSVEKAERVESEHEKVRSRWGPRRRLAREDRGRRREQWGRDS